MTRAQGSGVLRSARPSASGFSCCLGAVAVTVPRSLFWALLEVAAEAPPHRGEHAVAPVGLAARGEAVEQRGGEYRGGHALLDRGLNCPPPFARIAHAACVLLGPPRPAASSGPGVSCSASAAGSSSHEAMTEPRRQTSVIAATSRSYW